MHIMPDLYGTRDINVLCCVCLVRATDHYIKVKTTILKKLGDQLTNICVPKLGHGPAVKQLNLCVSVFQVTYIVVSIKLEGIVK